MPKLWRTPVEVRFWRRVKKTDTCWLWQGSQNGKGYASIEKDVKGERVYVHRLVYELLVGPIPEGMTIDHLCRVRHCVNPAHLRAVTLQVNNSWNTWALKTHCPTGHEYTVENTNMYRGSRHCRTCHKLRERARRAIKIAQRTTSNLDGHAMGPQFNSKVTGTFEGVVLGGE